MSDDAPHDALFRARFPIALGASRLEYDGIAYESWESRATLRLVVGDEVREERIVFDQYAHDAERVAAFLTALARVLGRGAAASIAQSKPSDLFAAFVLAGRASTVDELEAELSTHLAWLLAGGDPPSVALARLEEVCRDVFPLKAANELASLEFVGLALVGTSLRMTIRLITWDGEPPVIRDVKEQELYFGGLADHAPARTRALFEGMQIALARVLEVPAIETLMPHELFRGDVMKLKTCITADDFARALLVKSRLGKFLAAPEVAVAAAGPLATPAELAALCTQVFPMRTAGGTTLEFVEATSDGTNLSVALRFGGAAEACGLAVAGAYDRGRVHALFAATRAVLAELACSEVAQPSELLFPELLAKRGIRSEADFARALRTKARLGRFTS